jgi:hypothetical protein
MGPLSPALYLRRNVRRVLPLAVVVALAVTLVGTVSALLDSVDLTIRTTYGYLRYFTTVGPNNAMRPPEAARRAIARDPRTGSVVPAGVVWIGLRTMIGRQRAPIFAVSPQDARALLGRCEQRVAAGRLPAPGSSEVAIAAEWARNARLRVGSAFEGEGFGAPSVPLRVSGLLEGPCGLGIASDRFVAESSFLPVQALLVLSQRPTDQDALGETLRRRLRRQPVTVTTLASALQRTHRELAQLFLITRMIQATVILIVALTMGLLTYIYYSQRAPEFALLVALGYGRRTLLRRLVGEVALMLTGAWAFGLALNAVVLHTIWLAIMRPRAMALDPLDLPAYFQSAYLPVVVMVFAVATVARQVSTLDPVTVIERRL